MDTIVGVFFDARILVSFDILVNLLYSILIVVATIAGV